MNELIAPENGVKNLIYELRGKQVMLDSDLARLYECANGTKDVNKAVKRNAERFPEDFYFQITEEEFEFLRFQNGTARDGHKENLKFQFGTSSCGELSRFQNGTLNDETVNPSRFQLEAFDGGNPNLKSQNVTSNHGGIRKLPHAFTEQGVAMLATVLRTPVAAQMNVKIMRAFVTMRRYISESLLEQTIPPNKALATERLLLDQPHINSLVLEDHDRLKLLESSFKKFEEKQAATAIYFNGQIYDAYSKIASIFKSAKRSLVIIDNYADETVLDLIKTLKNVTIITSPKNTILSSQLLEKYKSQYKNLKIKYDSTFHDRYFILDGETVYHCGASINRIGHKTFSITKISDEAVKTLLLETLRLHV